MNTTNYSLFRCSGFTTTTNADTSPPSTTYRTRTQTRHLPTTLNNNSRWLPPSQHVNHAHSPHSHSTSCEKTLVMNLRNGWLQTHRYSSFCFSHWINLQGDELQVDGTWVRTHRTDVTPGDIIDGWLVYLNVLLTHMHVGWALIPGDAEEQLLTIPRSVLTGMSLLQFG